MPRLGNINQYEQKKAQRKADALPAVQAASPSFISQAQVNNPTLEEMTWKNTGIVPIPGQGEYRTQALRDMNEDEFAKHQHAMNASDKEYWVEQAKINPTSSYVNLRNYLASQETPEQKQKRERREQLGEVFNNLGNLIGNAANLYYTTKGGQYIDLNSVNEKHRARMERLREKQDALKQRQNELLGKAKLSDIQAGRAERAAKVKADADAKAKELDYKRDLALKQIEHALRIGQIDAQTAANMKRDAAKLKTDKEMEDYRQKNRESLAESNHQRIIDREEARGGGSRATVRVPRKNGNGYDEYRKNDLMNPIVISQIYNSLPDEYKSQNQYEEPTLLTMQSAIGKALTDGKITEISSEIELTGGKKKGSKSLPGVNKKENKSLPGVNK